MICHVMQHCATRIAKKIQHTATQFATYCKDMPLNLLHIAKEFHLIFQYLKKTKIKCPSATLG